MYRLTLFDKSTGRTIVTYEYEDTNEAHSDGYNYQRCNPGKGFTVEALHTIEE